MANEAKFKMSTERLEELKTELDYLQTVRKKEVEEQIKEARAFGDLSENSEFDEAKREQGKLYGRMAELKNLVENAEVVDAAAVGGGVGIGSVVVVLDLEDNYEAEYRIVGSQEADPANNLISGDSPFGKALMGGSEGDEIVVEAPAGKLRYKLKKIIR